MAGRPPALAALLVAAVALACGMQAGGDERPNLAIVVLDTLRADHLGLYGYSRATSPRLDQLASGCAVFDAAQSAAPWTAPSLASMLTSQLPSAHGVNGFPIPAALSEDALTLAELLRARGYATAAFTEGGYAKRGFGLEQGFERYPLNPGDERNFASNQTHPSRLRANIDRTLRWLDEPREAPFFLLFHSYEIHAPLRAPDPFVRRFHPGYDGAAEHARIEHALEAWERDGSLSDEDAALIGRHVIHDGFHMPGEGWTELRRERPDLAKDLHRGPDGSAYLRWFIDLYDAEIAYTDRELARLWRALVPERQRRPTFVVVVSDHGEGLGDHGELEHGWGLHEALLRVALVVCGPAPRVAARRIPDVVSTLDLMPTLLELSGVGPVTPPLQGHSLLPLLAGGSAQHPALSEAVALPGEERRHRSVRTEHWRLILDTDTGEARLFDRRIDPGELRDVAVRHPEVTARLRALLEASSVGVPPRAGGPAPVDTELRQQLRELGYIEEAPDR